MTTKPIPFKEYPDLVLSQHGAVLAVQLNRAKKRNALNDSLIAQLRDVFINLPKQIGCVVIHGAGDHFCAGLDLSDIRDRDAVDGLHHSRSWHVAMDDIQLGPVPVVAALHGAVVGGGLELATACHIRVAEDSAFYALPEGSRGIYVGGGGSVRIGKLIGVARMTDMMLTGRVYNAEEGERLGFAQYRVAEGEALNKALALAARICENAPLTNYALIQALPRIADQTADHGHFTEALMGAIAQSAPEAKKRLKDFLEGRAAKVKKAD
jgi:(methylthio)acryloyl-CoA hydratase